VDEAAAKSSVANGFRLHFYLSEKVSAQMDISRMMIKPSFNLKN
jgi:hypothetical protein